MFDNDVKRISDLFNVKTPFLNDKAVSDWCTLLHVEYLVRQSKNYSAENRIIIWHTNNNRLLNEFVATFLYHASIRPSSTIHRLPGSDTIDKYNCLVSVISAEWSQYKPYERTIYNDHQQLLQLHNTIASLFTVIANSQVQLLNIILSAKRNAIKEYRSIVTILQNQEKLLVKEQQYKKELNDKLQDQQNKFTKKIVAFAEKASELQKAKLVCKLFDEQKLEEIKLIAKASFDYSYIYKDQSLLEFMLKDKKLHDIVKQLIASPKFDYLLANGKTILEEILSKSLDGFKLLLSLGANIDMKDSQGRNLLHEMGDDSLTLNNEILNILKIYKIDLNAINNNGYTAMQQACLNGNNIAFDKLLSMGADDHVIDQYGNTLLHLATLGSSLEIIKKIIETYKNKAASFIEFKNFVNTFTNGSDKITAAWCAEQLKYDKIAKYLNDNNTSQTSSSAISNIRALYEAVQAGNLTIIKTLTNKIKNSNCSIEELNTAGINALITAAKAGQNDMVNFLFGKTADSISLFNYSLANVSLVFTTVVSITDHRSTSTLIAKQMIALIVNEPQHTIAQNMLNNDELEELCNLYTNNSTFLSDFTGADSNLAL